MLIKIELKSFCFRKRRFVATTAVPTAKTKVPLALAHPSSIRLISLALIVHRKSLVWNTIFEEINIAFQLIESQAFILDPEASN